MNLYLLSQNVNNDYDTFDSCIVCAENEHEAKIIRPDAEEWGGYIWGNTWADTPEQVKVKYIGIAANDVVKGIVLASYNAG